MLYFVIFLQISICGKPACMVSLSYAVCKLNLSEFIQYRPFVIDIRTDNYYNTPIF